MTKIGIFGGSFDPVHNGHVGIARRAVRELGLDKLFVVPAALNPFKASPGAEPLFPPEARLAMARAAFADVPGAVVDGREIERGGVSYAIDTVRAIAAGNPGAKIFFLVGEDAFEGVPRWKDADALAKLCEFSVFPRTAESSTEIRRRLRAGESVRDLVPSAVADAIEARAFVV